MENNNKIIFFLVTLFLVAFPTSTLGNRLNQLPKPVQGWPKPADLNNNKMFMFTGVNKNQHPKFNYDNSKTWRCVSNNGSGPAVSISFPGSPPVTYPKPPTIPTPFPKPPTVPTPTPKPPTVPAPKPPSVPAPTPKPPSVPTPTPKPPTVPAPKPPSVPTPTPKPPVESTPKTKPTPKAPSEPSKPTPTPSPATPGSNPAPEGRQFPYVSPLVHYRGCMMHLGASAVCRRQIELSYHTGWFNVSEDCCRLIINMKKECDDVIFWFKDPYFLPLVRCTCNVQI